VMGLRKEPTDVALLIFDAVRALEPESRAHQVQVSVDAPADLGLVEVDPVRLREVVINLVVNAVRHSRPGAAVAVSAAASPDWLVMRVRDNGPGIGREELGRIFDRFHKGARSQGSGLGLAIARQLVEAHGGEIAVESEVGTGTVFTVKVPRRPIPIS
jgi:two-component system, OmpR family, sensor histidine kinase BaeS